MESILLSAQKNEITEHYIYSKLSEKIKDARNKQILKKISQDELKHYNYWKTITKTEVKPNWIKIYLYILLASILGITFTLKFMEQGENLAIKLYKKLKNKYKINSLVRDEQKHEDQILILIKEERIEYASSIVLGLNDALVELTGALAGFTFSLQNSKLIATVGFITGVAASMSMAASGYLSSKEEGSKEKSPFKSALYTGLTYISTVIILILPFLLLKNVYLALILTLSIGFLIIAAYTFYITTAKNLKFWRRFLEMASLSLTVAIITFLIGFLVRKFFGI